MINCRINIVAFNRPDSLKRLLWTIENALFHYNLFHDIIFELNISIDYSESNCCFDVAQNWKNRIETVQFKNLHVSVIHRESNLGLKRHIILIGDESVANNADFFVVLEDDLIVSPVFFDFIRDLLMHDDIILNEKIAQISLFSPRYSDITRSYWSAIDDGYQNFYMQIPTSWGQLYSKSQWLLYKKYLLSRVPLDYSILPVSVKNWDSNTSWKKDFFHYIISQSKFVFYPRFSLTSNIGDVGIHFSKLSFRFRTSLLMFSSSNYNFSRLEKSRSKYDWDCVFLESFGLSDVIQPRHDYLDMDWWHFPIEITRYFSGKEIEKDMLNEYQSRIFDANGNLRNYYIKQFIESSLFLRCYYYVYRLKKRFCYYLEIFES